MELRSDETVTYGLHLESERYAVRFARLTLEMECLDKVIRICVDIVLRYSLSNHLNVVGDADNMMFARQILMDLVTVNLVDSNGPSLRLIIQLSFLDETCDNVVHITVLGDENIICLLILC
jgi:hypothetical protein